MKTKLFALALITTALVASNLEAKEDGTQWRLTIEATPLRPITLRDPVTPMKYRTYWYSILDVTNKTGAAHDLFVSARAELGLVHKPLKGESPKKRPVVRPGLLPNVTAEIAKRERRSLENVLAVKGSIGDGQTKHLVVVFADLPRTANHIDVRINGFANSLYNVGKSAWIEKTEASIRYFRVGDEFNVTREPVRVEGITYKTVDRKLIRKFTPVPVK